MDFHPVEANLRESFRALAAHRPRADVAELPGVSIASLAVAFQMFNAAFLNAPVPDAAGLSRALDAARQRFAMRNVQWSFWCCEDWLPKSVRRGLSRACEGAGLHLVAELPGMMADGAEGPGRRASDLEIRPVTCDRALEDFRSVGATCFHVPSVWFREVFDRGVVTTKGFRCFVGYRDGEPVSTAAFVVSDDAIGIYNVATLPGQRNRGYADAITRRVIAEAAAVGGPRPVTLQSTTQGFGLYRRMGFRQVTRFLVYNSVR